MADVTTDFGCNDYCECNYWLRSFHSFHSFHEFHSFHRHVHTQEYLG